MQRVLTNVLNYLPTVSGRLRFGVVRAYNLHSKQALYLLLCAKIAVQDGPAQLKCVANQSAYALHLSEAGILPSRLR